MKPNFFLPFPFVLFPVFFLLLLASSLPSSLSIDYHYSKNCFPQSCGGLINVTFPFWIRELQPDYCGYPPFELQCKNGVAKLSMMEEDYHVLNISYDNRTATVSMSSNFTAVDNCLLLPYYNLSSPLTPFIVSSLNRELVFVYNCSAAAAVNRSTEIACRDNRSFVYLGGEYQVQESKGSIGGACFSTVIPVLNSPGAEIKNYYELLGNGFLLNWSAPDCLECMRSNGQCGYNNLTRTFMCICSDRAHSESCFFSAGKNNKTTVIAGISGTVAFLLLFILFVFLLQRRIRKLKASNIRLPMDEDLSNVEIKMIDFSALKKATNNFAIQNKLGQGGFGPVYKGVLNGLEIAVKRLSATSLQGLQEMKNEIQFVANLRHKNLVRLLGYCLQGEEKLLIYEFLPNTSLDKFLFNPIRKTQLDWETRLKIIVGVGRGLLYLHEDSHLRIVHRDLKASNILLDSDMNPKISDFGLAKLFKINETEGDTSRIAGTLGYMAPEYVLHGRFSTKSDVFSYGVLVLEIITGMKLSMFESEEADNLQSYVWQNWREGKALEVVDRSLEDGYSPQEALRCVQIGLLCVQEDQMMRPKMGSVVTMLSSSSMKLEIPSMPAFYKESSIPVESESAPRSGEESLIEVGR